MFQSELTGISMKTEVSLGGCCAILVENLDTSFLHIIVINVSLSTLEI